MSQEFVNIEVDGVPLKAPKGEMIIRVTDANGFYVPRFCYHEKLSVAANCRMCLVEVEKAPKPLPACATPVAEGMKIFTKSARAVDAQQATMEFLLINHPLDCPICDQGGECELQDLSMGYGRDIARFAESKRVVKDKNIGPLIATDMTRCIHCTRCIRFGQEVAGIQELGTTSRGDRMTVGTYIERSVNHELSGNVIDLCPVGALIDKSYRYRARGWEMTAHPSVSPHDGIGTNIMLHVRRGRVMRVVPRRNEAINETWIADRDRYGYEGLYSADRLSAPAIREGGGWRTTDWETALTAAAEGLKRTARSLGALASATATLEELYLVQRLARALGSPHVDHRLRQHDFRDAAGDPLHPGLGLGLADVEQLDGLLVVGSNLRRELPLLAHRVRKAVVRHGARVAFLNPAKFDYLFPVAGYLTAPVAGLVGELAAVLAAAAEQGTQLPDAVAEIVRGARPKDAHRELLAALTTGKRRAIWLGALALRHPAYADLRALAAVLAQLTGATLGLLAEGGNAVGAWLAGAVPHRESGGRAVPQVGHNAREMLERPLAGYLLFGALEPWADSSCDAALSSLGAADFVVAATPYVSETLRQVAHVLLPIGSFVETSGTFVNLEGRWQSFTGAAAPPGEARPGWKVLRVLGNLVEARGFEYQSSEDVREELRQLCAGAAAGAPGATHRVVPSSGALPGVVDVPMYQTDAMLRRAYSLQMTADGRTPAVVY
ncbi:MAG: NADH-quinone oxidoreductase subunit G [Gammaproteobacteria bacterium]|nr:NADH-quinone oxidoreductase subunit G [Gammaproteobacteria bacterium]